MKISFSTLGCPRWSWNDIVTTAADLKYNGIEVRGVGKDISAHSIPQFGADMLPATKEQLKKLGLEIPCLTSDICLHVREREDEVMREIAAYIDLAAVMGVPYIRIMGCAGVAQPTGQVDAGYVRDMAARCGALAAEKGVTLLMETNGVWAQTDKLRRLLDDIDSPNVAALWDVNHPYRYFGESAQTTWDNVGKYVRHMHLKDSVMQDGRARYAILGYGDLPLEQIIETTQKAGYEGFYSLEWLKRWDVTLEEPGIVLAHYVSYMRSFA